MTLRHDSSSLPASPEISAFLDWRQSVLGEWHLLRSLRRSRLHHTQHLYPEVRG